MTRLTRALVATYNFFAGDAIVLVAVACAFLLAWLLIHVVGAPIALAGAVFLVLIVAGLTTTLARERPPRS